MISAKKSEACRFFSFFQHILPMLGMVAVFAGISAENAAGRQGHSTKESQDQKKGDIAGDTFHTHYFSDFSAGR